MSGKLYLIPNTLGDSPIGNVLPASLAEVLHSINHYIVEEIRTARRFLIKAGLKTPIDDLKFYELNKHSDKRFLAEYLLPLQNGENVGVISEAGCPGIADPGADVVELAHKQGFTIVPIVGPSSILLALMASGMNGQNFAFVGYLPVKQPQRIKRIEELERRSSIENQSQLFIEAPYRNTQLLTDILATCSKSTLLCIAADITLATEFIVTKTVEQWKKGIPDINKRPAIFILHKKATF